MLDAKVVGGTLIVAGATANSWVESANAYGTLAVTAIGVMVGVATLYYTVLRVISLRRNIRSHEDEE